MSPVMLASVRSILASARVGGGLAIATLIVLFIAQALHWTRAPRSRALTAVLVIVSGLFCALLAVFITGRFLIID